MNLGNTDSINNIIIKWEGGVENSRLNCTAYLPVASQPLIAGSYLPV